MIVLLITNSWTKCKQQSSARMCYADVPQDGVPCIALSCLAWPCRTGKAERSGSQDISGLLDCCFTMFHAACSLLTLMPHAADGAQGWRELSQAQPTRQRAGPCFSSGHIPVQAACSGLTRSSLASDSSSLFWLAEPVGPHWCTIGDMTSVVICACRV